MTIPGEKPEKAEDTQVIFADALLGIADKSQCPAFNIRKAANQIDDSAISLKIKRIDGEIAPRRIHLPIPSEGNSRMTPVGFHISA